MTRRFGRITQAAAFSAAFGAAAPLWAQVWENTTGNNQWGTVSNWSPAFVPGPGSNPLFTDPYTSTVNLGSVTRTVGTLSIQHIAPTNAYNFTNGTLAANSIESTGTVGDTIAIPIIAAGSAFRVGTKVPLTFSGGFNIGTCPLTKTFAGTLTLNSASFSGGATVQDGRLLALSSTAAGSGAITTNSTMATLSLTGTMGWMDLGVAQMTLPNITVNRLSILGGDVTGAVYSGAGQNVFLQPDAVLGVTNGPVPVRGVDVASAAYFRAITTASGSYSVGDAPTSIYEGAAIGLLSGTSNQWAGTLSENTPGAGFNVAVGGNAIGPTASFDSSNITSGVKFVGPFPMAFAATLGGSANVYTCAGDSGQTAYLGDVAGLAAGKTLNVNNCIVTTRTATTSIGGTINVNDGGTLRLGAALSSGTVNVNAGGQISVESAVGYPTGGVTFNYAVGSQILFKTNTINTSGSAPGSTWLPTTADYVIAYNGGTMTFGGAGIVMGQGRRLYRSMNGGAITGGPGISAAAGVTDVAISSKSTANLTIFDPINLAGVNVKVDDPGMYFATGNSAAVQSYQRVSGDQTGQVTFAGPTTTGSVSIEIGTLKLGDSTLQNSVYNLGSLNVSGTATVYYGYGPQLLLNDLQMSGDALLEVQTSPFKTLRTKSFSMSDTATLSLNNNQMIASNAPVGSWSGSSYDGVTGLLASGRNGNATPLWDGGFGIITQIPTAIAGNYETLGIAKGVEAKPYTASETAIWNGQTITGTDTLVMYTYGGDANLDGKINIDDYIRIDNGIAAHLTGWSNGDFNYDGKVNIDDYTQFIDANIATQGPPFAAASSGGSAAGTVSAVPEPLAGMVVIFPAMLPLLRRRSRRRRLYHRHASIN